MCVTFQSSLPKGFWSFSDVIFSSDLEVVVIKGYSQKLKARRDILLELLHKTQEAENSEVSGVFGGEEIRVGGDTDFAVDFAGERFRATRSTDVNGRRYYYLRRIEPELIPLRDQGYDVSLRSLLMDKERRGLVIFSGGMGQGKTTGASAMLDEWLKMHGGTAETLEDPPEYMLQGWHGDGFCVQHKTATKELADSLACTMRRASPEIIYVGEIRQPLPARQAVLAAVNGHMVVSTIHAGSIAHTIWRLISLADDDGGGESLLSVLADGLSLIVYQRIRRVDDVVLLTTDVLDCDPGHEIAIRGHIRARKPQMLGDFIKSYTNTSFIGTQRFRDASSVS